MVGITRYGIGAVSEHGFWWRMRILALALIKLYQRHLSPRKGYCCAYRAYTGHASCSALAYRAIQRFGVWCGIGILRLRLVKCGVAHRRYRARPAVLNRQAGFCDLSCDLPCDLDVVGTVGDVFSCLEIPGDCCGSKSSQKKQKNDQWVYIPPNTKFESKLKNKEK